MVSIFAEFCESTSAHGFLDFSKATGRCLRSFWALIIAISFVTIGYFVCQVVDDYLSAPLITNSVQNYSKTMVIPYAAVCNPAILNTTKLEEDGFPVETIYSIIKYYNTYSFGQDSNLYNELYHSSMKADFLRRMESVLGEKNFTKFILKYAYPCEKIFSEIVMERESKAVDEFCAKYIRMKLHFEYLACYVAPGMPQTWPGMSAGIGLTLRIPNISDKYATAFYQKGYFLEFAVDFEGFTYNSLRVPSNMATDIAIHVTEFRRLARKQWPKGSDQPLCLADTNSSNICFFKCYANVTQRLCGCKPPGSGTTAQDYICSPFEMCLTEERDEWAQEMRVNYESCKRDICKPACVEPTFACTVTYHPLESNVGFFTASHSSQIAPAERFLHVRYAYPLLQHTIIEEQEASTLAAAISNIGGQAGLWLGCSVITFIQAMYYGILGIRNSINKRNESRNRKKLNENMIAGKMSCASTVSVSRASIKNGWMQS